MTNRNGQNTSGNGLPGSQSDCSAKTPPAGPQNLVVGIGSAHGDDQAGWRLIDRLAEDPHLPARLRKASVPHDMIDWLDDCQTLHIADACDTYREVQRLEISDDGTAGDAAGLLTQTRSRSSHQLGIASVIKLARSLGMLPPRIVVWAIPGTDFQPPDQLSQACVGHIESCVQRLRAELDPATAE